MSQIKNVRESFPLKRANETERERKRKGDKKAKIDKIPQQAGIKKSVRMCTVKRKRIFDEDWKMAVWLCTQQAIKIMNKMDQINKFVNEKYSEWCYK